MEERQGKAPVGLGPLDGHGVVDGVTEGVPDGMQELEDGVAEG